MNQSVLFPDLQYWDYAHRRICFVAQAQGVNIKCYISATKLHQLHGTTEPTSVDEAAAMLAIFDAVRFDAEDIAEELIAAEAFDDFGAVTLG